MIIYMRLFGVVLQIGDTHDVRWLSHALIVCVTRTHGHIRGDPSEDHHILFLANLKQRRLTTLRFFVIQNLTRIFHSCFGTCKGKSTIHGSLGREYLDIVLSLAGVQTMAIVATATTKSAMNFPMAIKGEESDTRSQPNLSETRWWFETLISFYSTGERIQLGETKHRAGIQC